MHYILNLIMTNINNFQCRESVLPTDGWQLTVYRHLLTGDRRRAANNRLEEEGLGSMMVQRQV